MRSGSILSFSASVHQCRLGYQQKKRLLQSAFRESILGASWESGDHPRMFWTTHKQTNICKHTQSHLCACWLRWPCFLVNTSQNKPGEQSGSAHTCRHRALRLGTSSTVRGCQPEAWGRDWKASRSHQEIEWSAAKRFHTSANTMHNQTSQCSSICKVTAVIPF